jgi:hypothetical protein
MNRPPYLLPAWIAESTGNRTKVKETYGFLMILPFILVCFLFWFVFYFGLFFILVCFFKHCII